MLHFGKIQKKMVKFGENSATFWQNLRTFGKNSKKFSNFNANFEIRLENDEIAFRAYATMLF